MTLYTTIKKYAKFVLGVTALFFASSSMAIADENTYHLKVGDFSELQVVDNINVVLRCNADSAGLAVFTTTPEVVKAIMFETNKGKLKIERNFDIPLIPEHFPTVTVYSNFINSVGNYGDSTLVVERPAPGAQIKVTQQGNGTIRISGLKATQTNAKLETGKGLIVIEGATQNVKLSNVGTGTIDASGLTAQEGTVNILGTGTVECCISKELTVRGMGSGKIYLRGTPVIKQRSLGSIKIIPTEQ